MGRVLAALLVVGVAFGQYTPPSGGASSCSGDINTGCSQVTGTHLASPLPITQGGTGATTLAGASIVLTGQANAFGSFLQTLGQLGVGPSNTSLGTVTASILDRTATTGATSVYIGSDNNGHTSATTTQTVITQGSSQSTTSLLRFVGASTGTAIDFATDATMDIGGAGVNRPRNINLSGSLTAGGTVIAGGSGLEFTVSGNIFLQAPSAGVLRITSGSGAVSSAIFGSATNQFPEISITSQTNPIFELLDGAGGSTAQLQVPGTAATGSGDVNVCWKTTGIFTQGSVCGTSLATYKQNIQPTQHGLDYVMQMRPVTFDWKKDGKSDLGLIADEVAAIDPLLGAYRANGELYNFKDRAVLATLVKAVQELQERKQDK